MNQLEILQRMKEMAQSSDFPNLSKSDLVECAARVLHENYDELSERGVEMLIFLGAALLSDFADDVLRESRAAQEAMRRGPREV